MKLIDLLYQDHGFPIVLGIVIAGIAIWFITHFMSEKGTEVSVLFGLVKYTKQKPNGFFSQARPEPKKSKKNNSSPFFKEDNYKVITVNDSDRIYINRNLEELSKQTEHMTRIQQEKFYEENFYHKWMRIEGRIVDIVENYKMHMVILSTYPMLMFHLSENEIDKISHLKKGDKIIIDGEISQISYGHYSFKKSKIINIDALGSN